VFGNDQVDLLRTGVEEALACKDMLAREPRRPRRLARVAAEVRRLVATAIWRLAPRRTA
jgi:hypothetical protein